MSDISENFSGEIMSCKLENNNLVIRLPLDFLVWVQKQREESIIITDINKMGEYLTRNFMEFGGNQEIGSTAFEELIDSCFIDALESGEHWLIGWWEINEDSENDD